MKSAHTPLQTSPSTPATSFRPRAAVLAGVVVILDQVSKSVAAGMAGQPLITPTTNHDAAFGAVAAPWWVLCTAAVAVIALIARAHRRWALFSTPWWAVPVFTAGAVSNFLDRIVLGSVRDFVATPWFVFNLADVAIAAAVIGWYGSAARRLLHPSGVERPPRTSDRGGR